mmetsp:Transcript_49926/g.93442  ORF Transcript_49926/g.93442 Transcript_49926/m.93442 type:complete len:190 (-) Transcript_49926:45-614(-)
MEDLAQVRFMNDDFLQKHGLTVSNVLDYFYTSPFYLRCGGPESLNELRRRGGVIDEAMATTNTEFVLVCANDDAKEGRMETSIFVLQRVLRRPGEAASPRETFYILAGTIYKAPPAAEIFDAALCQSAVAARSILAMQLDVFQRTEEESIPANGTRDPESTWPAWCHLERPAMPPSWLRTVTAEAGEGA